VACGLRRAAALVDPKLAFGTQPVIEFGASACALTFRQ
jgi:hypothetical protein